MSTELDENPVAQAWFIIRDSQEYGPCTEVQIQQLGSMGHLLPSDGIKLPDGRVYQAKQFRGLIMPIMPESADEIQSATSPDLTEAANGMEPEPLAEDSEVVVTESVPVEAVETDDVDVLDEVELIGDEIVLDEEDVSDSPTVISQVVPSEAAVEVVDDFSAENSEAAPELVEETPELELEETTEELPVEPVAQVAVPVVEKRTPVGIGVPQGQPLFAAEPIRAALFIDFDNVILGLERCGEFPAAESLRNNPMVVVQWLEQGMPGVAQNPRPRRLLRSVCYSNPISFGDYRESFINSGFRVVDCPPLTGWGKTAADMEMAIDILDGLQHNTRFDEFIIFSGDADFRPVLMRLKEYDRRTTVIAVQNAAESYQAVTDQFIGAQDFVANAFGENEVRSHVYTDMVHRLIEETAETDLTWDEAWQIIREFPSCEAKGRWMGFRNVKSLLDCLIAHDYQLARANGRGPAEQLAYRATRQSVEKIGRKESMMINKLYRATSSGDLASYEIRDYLREFTGYSHRDHWMGFGTQWELIRHLVAQDDRMELRTEGKKIVGLRRKRKNRRRNKERDDRPKTDTPAEGDSLDSSSSGESPVELS